jgi:hypothetical protein
LSPSADPATSASTLTGRVTARWEASTVGLEPKGEGGLDEAGWRSSGADGARGSGGGGWNPEGRAGRELTRESSLGRGPAWLSPRGPSPGLGQPASTRTWSAGPRRAILTR